MTKLPDNYEELSTEDKLQVYVDQGDSRKANLTPMEKGSKQAKEIASKGLEKRRENMVKREAMRQAVAAFGNNKLDATEDLTSLDTLRIIRNMYIVQGDLDKAADISKVLAEYEAPKKSRIEEIRSEVDFNDYKESDVQAYLDNVISLEELRSRKTG